MLPENSADNNGKLSLASYLDFNKYSHLVQLADGETDRWICPVCEGNNLTTSEDGYLQLEEVEV